jgi:predicted nucleotidyltransferase
MAQLMSDAQIKIYRQTALARAQSRREHLAAQRQKARELAQRAAALLKEEFGATQVALFGSLVHEKRFHAHSDLDLAIWGLDERHYFRAVARLLALDPEMTVDLVEFEHARPALQAVILNEGVIL